MTSVRVTTRCNTTPAGQDYVKQPNTCRPVIAGRAMEMTLELYQSPAKMGDDVSAVRLRQVGYPLDKILPIRIQIGNQCISPLAWPMENDALEWAEAIIQVLLTLRADRDHHYYGRDALLKRHPEIGQMLTTDAPTVLPKGLNGLIWRPRTTEHGLQRASYYTGHLLIEVDGKSSQAHAWMAKANDPVPVCPSILALLVAWCSGCSCSGSPGSSSR